MAEFYSARGWEIPPLPWTNLSPPFSIRLRPRWRNHVWAYDFVQARTHDGRTFRMLTVIDEFTRECLVIEVARSLKHDDVLQVLADLFTRHGPPGRIRSDNGSEFTAIAVRE